MLSIAIHIGLGSPPTGLASVVVEQPLEALQPPSFLPSVHDRLLLPFDLQVDTHPPPPSVVDPHARPVQRGVVLGRVRRSERLDVRKRRPLADARRVLEQVGVQEQWTRVGRQVVLDQSRERTRESVSKRLIVRG